MQELIPPPLLVLAKNNSPHIHRSCLCHSRAWLIQEGILVQPVGSVAVKGAWLHGDTLSVTVGLLCQVKSFKHSEACNRKSQ